MNVSIRCTTEVNVGDIISRSGHSARMVEAIGHLHSYIARSTWTWVGEADGVVACVWGVITPTLLSNRAYIWLITTALAEEHQFLLVRYSRMALDELLEHYDEIHGHCMIGHSQSIRWLRWLGAEFSEPQGQLVPFVIRKKHG